MSKKSTAIADQIVKWRRHFHENPELSFQEYETSKYIADTLKTFPGIEVSHPTPTSVLGVFKGKSEGKVVALRADIDALPVEEEADVDFKSKKEGVMHACGHDVHAAILLGAAKIISGMKEELNGTVKFIFQHAEECPPGGAIEIVNAGVLDDVNMIFGLHVYPGQPAGNIGIREGAYSASGDVYKITVFGKGAHGSTPEKGIDPILIGCQAVCNIYNIVSRNVSAFEDVVISVGEFSSGNICNVIPPSAFIQLTVRTNKPEIQSYVYDRIHEIVEHAAKMYRGDYKIEYVKGYDSVCNDVEACDIVRRVAVKVVGKDKLFTAPKTMGGEDFSAYLTKTKGAFFTLGGGSPDKGYEFYNHHPKFKVDESSFVDGSEMFVEIVKEVLG